MQTETTQKKRLEILKRKITGFFEAEDGVLVAEAVHQVSWIVSRTTYLIKIFYLEHAISVEGFEINKEFIDMCFTVVQGKDVAGKKDAVSKYYQHLKECYDRHFAPMVIKKELSLSFILAYSRNQLLTSYTNNIIMRYAKYVGRYVLYTLASSLNEITGILPPANNRTFIIPKAIRKQAGNITNHLLYNVAIDPTDIEGVDVDALKAFCCIQRPKDTFIDSHIEGHMMSYLKKMVLMNRAFEENFQNLGNKRRLLSPLCLCSSMIPSFIRIDTNGLCQLLMTGTRIKEFVKEYERLYGVKLSCINKSQIGSSFSKLSGKTDVSDYENAIHATRIWKYLCKFESKKYKNILECHRKSSGSGTWVFDNMIMTDGCSINFQVTPLDGFKRSTFGGSKKHIKNDTNTQEFPHVNDADCLPEDGVKYVSSDPGKGCLTMLSDGYKNLKYTSKQRDRDTCKHARAKRSNKLSKNKKYTINDKSVHDYETQDLASYSKKSCVTETFAAHLQRQQEYETEAMKLYGHPFFRQSKFLVYCKTKSSEQKFINKIIDVFGGESNDVHEWMKKDGKQATTLSEIYRNNKTNNKNNTENDNADTTKKRIHILYGDWGRNPNLKNSPPTPGIGLRRRIHQKLKTITVPPGGARYIKHMSLLWHCQKPGESRTAK